MFGASTLGINSKGRDLVSLEGVFEGRQTVTPTTKLRLSLWDSTTRRTLASEYRKWPLLLVVADELI